MADPAELIDYTTMETAAMLGELGDNAAKWAAAFCQIARKLDGHAPDEGWMIGWFANAIEHSHSIRTRAALRRQAVPTQGASADAEKLVDNLIVEARGYERLADVYNDELLRDARAAVLSARRGTTVPEGYVAVPKKPTEEMWSGLARDIVMWMNMGGRKTARSLFDHLDMIGRDIPQWLRDEPELQHLDHVPSKGTRAVIIYYAMIAAATETPR